VGTLAFAKSADGKFHVADVVSISPEGVHVRFLRGGELLLSPDEVRPCSFIRASGSRATGRGGDHGRATSWPTTRASRFVEVNDGWGGTETFPIADVWVEPPQKADVAKSARKRLYLTLIGTWRRRWSDFRVNRYGVADALSFASLTTVSYSDTLRQHDCH
jgi:hypothetical protein